MATARVTKITASSPAGFQDALNDGLSRAASTIRGITGLEVRASPSPIFFDNQPSMRLALGEYDQLEGDHQT